MIEVCCHFSIDLSSLNKQAVLDYGLVPLVAKQRESKFWYGIQTEFKILKLKYQHGAFKT